MSHIVSMTILDDADHLGKQGSGFALGEIAFSFEASEELFAFAVAV